MPNYRRLWVPGGTYFFTVTLADRRSTLLVDEIVVLRLAYREVMRRQPWITEAIVVLPEHLHCVWRLPHGDTDFAGRWQAIKSLFTRQLSHSQPVTARQRRKRERGIWQTRYWEHLIRDEADFRHHLEYIFFNPVKHGLVSQPSAWPYSTFHREVRSGRYPAEWAASPDAPDGEYGEA
jgi:putative transposase